MRESLRRHRPQLVIIGLILLFVLVLLAPRIFVVIGPGEAGVLYRPIFGGTVVDHVYGEGLWVLFPWNRMYVYNIRIQETRRTLDVLTRDGLTVTLDLSIRFRPDVSMVGVLHSTVGPHYIEKIVVPEVLSAVRQQIGNRTAEQLYTGQIIPDLPINAVARAAALISGLPMTVGGTAAAAAPVLAPGATPTFAESEEPDATPPAPRVPRLSVAELPNEAPSENVTLAQIVANAVQTVSRRYVIVDAVVLIKAELPPLIDAAIQAKLEQKQRAEAQLFRIQYAQRDVMLRQFEAQANVILAGSLTPSLLTWKGIEASKDLASSPNSKVIMIGNGADNLPVMLSTGGTP